jgi:hypothetical protein
MSVIFYKIQYDGQYPCAHVLESEARDATEFTGYYDAREIHENMQAIFGPDVQHLSASKFQQELEKRLIHTPEVVALLKHDGELLGQDLSQSFVYGSVRPISSLWARVHDAAVYIQTDKQATGYHTYVAVPARLDNEIIESYELSFVSHP